MHGDEVIEDGVVLVEGNRIRGVGRRGELAIPAGVRTVDGQFTLKRLKYKIGEGAWSDTDTVADDVQVRFRFTLPTK